MAQGNNSNSDFNIDAFNEGFRELSLTQQIKTILQQYPDDGQILKEIVQNADDAGASEVKFLLDLNCYSTTSLIKPELMEYQGPALLSYNDGLFQSKDWNEGITRMYESVKKDNPLKVGRFGLGFKSVFHMTDFPTLISGNGIAFMDPHKQFFTKKKLRGQEPTSSYIFDIAKHRNEILSARDQWLPYKHSVLGRDKEGFETGVFFNGTLFRFPLRRSSDSELSSTIYTPDRILQLFATIKNEGHLYLLFLKTISSIQLYSTKQGSMHLDFEVCLSDHCKSVVLAEKKKLLTNMETGNGYSAVYNVEIEIKSFENRRLLKREVVKFAVCQYFADRSHIQLHNLASQLSVTPLVGVAYPLDKASSAIGSQEFCFLPLTIEENNCTGLPFHVNGYFSVDNNRKHLKKQSVSRDNRDQGVEWNRLLIDTLMPLALTNLVLRSVSLNQLSRDQIYSMFPNTTTVKSFWLTFVKNFYAAIQSQSVIQVETINGSYWYVFNQVTVKQSNWSCEFIELAKRIFKSDGKYFAEIPDHIKTGFISYCNLYAREATVGDIGQSFSRVQYKTPWSQRDKLTLLLNLLQSRNYTSLINLQLLPLANGNWILFTYSNASRVIYLENGTNRKELLNGNVNDRFVNSQILSPELTTLLNSLAVSNNTQLKLFSPQYFQQEVSTLARSPPTTYAPNVTNLWTYLYHNFPNNLSNLSGLYLLPVSNGQIVKIPTASECVIENRGCISNEERQVLTSLGIAVIESIDQCAVNHPQIRSLVFDSSTDGKLNAILKRFNTLGSNQFSSSVSRMTPDQKRELRKLLSSMPHYQVNKFVTLVRSIPVFETLCNTGSSPVFVSVQNVRTAGPNFDYVLPLPNQVINQDATHSSQLLQMTAYVSIQTVATILTQILNSSISHHSVDKIERFIEQCISHGRNYSTLWQLLPNTAFVRTKSKGLVTPKSLLDPRDSQLKILFQNEDVFPEGKFSTGNYLNDLKLLGMRTSSNLTNEEVISVARCIHSNPSMWYNKSAALLQYFDNNLQIWRNVAGSLSSYSWVPVLRQAPHQYPQNLKWSGGDHYTQYLSNVRSHEYSLLCGSSCSIIASSSTICQVKPSLEEVCSHLYNCIQWSTEQTTQPAGYLKSVTNYLFSSSYKSNCMQILVKIYFYFQTDIRPDDLMTKLKEKNIDKWLFINDIFVAPSRCCFQQKFSNFPPYVYTVPQELNQYRHLLAACGVMEHCPYTRILKEMQESYQHSPAECSNQETDLQNAIAIINHLSQDSRVDCKELVLPVAGDNLKFMPLKACTYCDVKMHERGININDLEEENIHLIHPNLSSQIAENLGVPSLLSVLLSDENFGLDTAFGQYESLTTRIRNLLRDYRDGLAVIKELVQNADDAGASVVKIVYDERKHENHKSNLFDDKMKTLHGPSLLAYNDAIFTEDDFKNIIKLGGATKEKHVDKVGRFGLGFNSVYNLTEVPSFVSAHNIVFFDPHKKYLGKAMRDREQAGIKLDLTKRNVQRQLSLYSDQFHPLNGIFECDLNPSSPISYYPGTLFRLPLRNKEQALSSELSQKVYSDVEMKELLRLLYENRHFILIFTQNVKQIEVFSLKDGANLCPIFSVKKENAKCFDTLPSNTAGILQSTKIVVSQKVPQINRSSSVLHSICEINRSFPCEFIPDRAESDEKRFLICSSSGVNKAFNFALNNRDENFLPVGGVALEIASNFSPVITEKSLLFCFLPLPIWSKLAFHINGYFAVSSNRTELYSTNHQDKRNKNAEWNECVMSDPVMESCLRCFHILKENWPDCSLEEWYSLWPTFTSNSDSENPIQKLVMSFYNSVINRTEVCLFMGQGTFSSFKQCVFLEADFDKSAISTTARKILVDVLHRQDPSKTVVSIPREVIDCMKNHAHQEVIKHEYSRKRFYEEIALRNVDLIDEKDYTTLMLWSLHYLDTSDQFLVDLLTQSACIPASGNRNQFLKPDQLVDPSSKLAILFSEEDGRFPKWNKAVISDCLKSFQLPGDEDLAMNIFSKLRILGMVFRSLSWHDLIERSETVKHQELNLGIKRSECIVNIIKGKLQIREMSPTSEEKAKLLSTQFLPTLRSNLKAPLVWNNDKPDLWCSPNEGFLEKSKSLVSCSSPVIDFEKINHGGLSHADLHRFLELSQKSVTLDKVEFQLTSTLNLLNSEVIDNSDIKNELKRILNDVLTYFEVLLSEGQTLQTVLDLKNEPILYLEESQCFARPTQCVQTGRSFPPFIYSLVKFNTHKFSNLLKYLEIDPRPSPERYVESLRIIYNKFNDQSLTEDSLKSSVDILIELSEIIRKEHINPNELSIYAPDTNGRMRPVSELCINCCPWLKGDSFVFIHSRISYEIAKQLGVKESRFKLLSKHQCGIPFGQKEKLSRRINTILSGYPFDESILKELLQNADDAGAQELHFILDSKVYSKEKIFSDDWSQLQGPALLVYNDKPFTKSDIEAIQNLGEGNKRDDPVKTGQYGVGFNCVYHLTDCPAFITNVPDEGESLCVFDPLCKYVHGANESSPGQRFIDIANLEKKFPDVFNCYRIVQSAIGDNNGTLFRLPLRTREMAACSDLVDDKHEVTIDRVRTLFKKMSSCLGHYLLFLKNVKSIKFSELQANGTLRTLMKSDASVNQTCLDKLKDFNDHVRSEASTLKNTRCLEDVGFKEVSYEMNVETCVDQISSESRWLIIKRFGYPTSQEFPETLLEDYNDGNLGLLPLGGLAVPLPNVNSPHDYNLFCLLPLPMKSSIPVHINCHFALDYETRRNFSSKPVGKKWNIFVMQSIIAPLYLSLLEIIRSFSPTDNSYSSLKRFESWYFGKFPSAIVTLPASGDDLFSLFIQAFYHLLAHSSKEFYPMIIKQTDAKDLGTLSWHPLSIGAMLGTVFNTLPTDLAQSKESTYIRADIPNTVQYSRQTSAYQHRIVNKSYTSPTKIENQVDKPRVISDLLKTFGMILIDCPYQIIRSFLKFNVHVSVTSPEVLLTHFSNHSSCQSIVGKEINQTPFKSFDIFKLVFDYIFTQVKAIESVAQKAPLMLSSDGIVRQLLSELPIFSDSHRNLIPKRPDLFAHKDLVTRELKDGILKPYVSDFTLESLSKHLEEMLPFNEFSCCPVPMEKLFNNIEKKEWFFQIWRFLHENVTIESSKQHKQQKLCQYLGDWSLVPVLQNDKALLLPLKQLHYVINLETATELQRKAFKKLNLFEPNFVDKCPKPYSSFNSLEISLKTLVGAVSNQSELLPALNAVSPTFPQVDLSDNEASGLCSLFSSWLYNTQYFSGYQNLVKQIPMFIDVGGNVVSVSQCSRVHTLPGEIPTAGMGKWSHENNSIVFLTSNTTWDRLYKFIECSPINVGDVYVDVVLPRLLQMNQEDRMKHLEFLRDKSQNKSKWEEINRKDQILNILTNMAFIADKSGALYKACYFYHPNKMIYKLMVPDRLLPEKPFSAEWFDFLIKLGLIDKISEGDILKFADSISKSPQIELKNSERSEELVKVLFNEQHKNNSLLFKIKSIPFLCPHPMRKELTSLAPQFNPTGCSLIAFEHSASYQHETLIWTQCNILSYNYDPRKYIFNKQDIVNVSETLGILLEIPNDKVCDHLLTLCSNNLKNPNSEHFVSTVVKIFSHLNTVSSSLTSDQINRLKEKPIIPLRELLILAQPIHIVTKNLIEKKQMPPFLCALPNHFGQFDDLFIKLGAQESLSTHSYAEVLYQIHKLSGGKILDPNEREKVVTATTGFFEQLNEDGFVLKREILYLPSISEKRLHKSSEMFYIDDPSIKDGVKGFQEPIFYSLEKQFDFNSLFEKLPDNLRPERLTSILKEVIACQEFTDDTGGLFDEIKCKFKSDRFIDGVIRICLHHYSGHKPEEFEYIRDTLINLQLKSFTRFTTHLVYNDNRVAEREKFVFLAEESNSWVIYLHANPLNKLRPSIIFSLVQYLLKILKMDDKLFRYLDVLFKVDDNEIDEVLDQYSIKEYNGVSSKDRFLFHCGDFVPQELQCLLVEVGQDDEISIGTFVAYQILDPEDEDQPVFVVAKVLKVQKFENGRLSTMIEIDLGGRTQEVNILYLFKFERMNANYAASLNNTNMSVCLHENPSQSPPEYVADYDMEEAREEIRRTLREGQKLSKELYRQLIKRLLLKWHPDKNPYDVERCTEMFKFLKNEIDRAESGEYDTLFENINRRANYHSGCYSNAYSSFYNCGTANYSSGSKNYNHRNNWNNFSDDRSYYRANFDNRQPALAKLWMKQAETNLEVGDTLSRSSSYHEWICFTYRQAAELALKAVILATTGNMSQSNDLVHLSNGYQEVRSWCQQLQSLGSFSSFLYPDSVTYAIPCNRFTQSQSSLAKELAHMIIASSKVKISNS